jgi:hypothetical protein
MPSSSSPCTVPEGGSRSTSSKAAWGRRAERGPWRSWMRSWRTSLGSVPCEHVDAGVPTRRSHLSRAEPLHHAGGVRRKAGPGSQRGAREPRARPEQIWVRAASPIADQPRLRAPRTASMGACRRSVDLSRRTGRARRPRDAANRDRDGRARGCENGDYGLRDSAGGDPQGLRRAGLVAASGPVLGPPRLQLP